MSNFSTQIDQQSGDLLTIYDGFILSRKITCNPRTVKCCAEGIDYFRRLTGIADTSELIPNLLRSYLVKLAETRSEGGIRSAWRPVKAFVNWVWDEFDLENRPPTDKVKVKSDPGTSLPGVPVANVRKMLEVCITRMGIHDRAVLTGLLDTGARASEFLALNWGNVNLTTGIAIIRHGKGNKPRNFFIGRHSRKMLRKWNQECDYTKTDDPMWMTASGTRLKYAGLRQTICRRADEAGIDTPGIHDFRRTATLEMLRNGADPISVSRIDGHNDLKTTMRYLSQTVDDLYQVHERSSPLDNMN